MMDLKELKERLEKDFSSIKIEEDEIILNISLEYDIHIEIIDYDYEIGLKRFDKIEGRMLEEDIILNMILFDDNFLYEIIRNSILKIKEL